MGCNVTAKTLSPWIQHSRLRKKLRECAGGGLGSKKVSAGFKKFVLSLALARELGQHHAINAFINIEALFSRCRWGRCMYTYVYIYMYVYMYIYMYFCIYVHMYTYVDILAIYVIYVYMYIWYICIYIYVYIYVNMYICKYVNMYICIYVYMYICKYVYM